MTISEEQLAEWSQAADRWHRWATEAGDGDATLLCSAIDTLIEEVRRLQKQADLNFNSFAREEARAEKLEAERNGYKTAHDLLMTQYKDYKEQAAQVCADLEAETERLRDEGADTSLEVEEQLRRYAAALEKTETEVERLRSGLQKIVKESGHEYDAAVRDGCGKIAIQVLRKGGKYE